MTPKFPPVAVLRAALKEPAMATPGWTCEKHSSGECWTLRSPSGGVSLVYGRDMERDARSICTAMNSNGPLVEALKAARSGLRCEGRYPDTNDTCGVTYTCRPCLISAQVNAALALTEPAFVQQLRDSVAQLEKKS